MVRRRSQSPGTSDIPVKLQPSIISLAVGRLKDKSSNVRKAAIKFLAKMIESSPFTFIAQDDGKLSLRYFEAKKKSLQDLLEVSK
jgi:condensin complex subunit 1